MASQPKVDFLHVVVVGVVRPNGYEDFTNGAKLLLYQSLLGGLLLQEQKSGIYTLVVNL